MKLFCRRFVPPSFSLPSKSLFCLHLLPKYGFLFVNCYYFFMWTALSGTSLFRPSKIYIFQNSQTLYVTKLRWVAPLEVEHLNSPSLLAVTVPFQKVLCASHAFYALMICDEVASMGPIFNPVIRRFSAGFVSISSCLVQNSRRSWDSNLHPPNLIHGELDHRVMVPCLLIDITNVALFK